MKKILLALSVIIVSFGVTGCSDWLDINQNPNYPTEVNAEALLPSAIVYSTTQLGGNIELVGSFWSQHYCQYTSSNQYVTVMQNNLAYTDNFFSGGWIAIYRNALPTLNECIKAAQKQGESYDCYVYVCKVLQAFNWHILNSLYDQIAFDEGLNGLENLTPKFNTSTESYDRIVAMLAELVAANPATLQAKSDLVLAGKGKDFLFDGDMASWVKFARTVYVKMLMRKFDSNKTKIAAMITAGLLDEVSGDAKLDIYVDLPNKSNPIYESDRRQLNTNKNIRACNSLLNYLKSNGDLRYKVIYEANSGGGYTGGNYGSGGGGTTSRANLAATDPVYMASMAEAYFLIAEYYARMSQPVQAKIAYDKAVSLAFERWNLDGSTLLAVGGAYEFTSLTTEAMLKQIMTQKWIAAARCQAWDSWFDINRTGYPAHGEVLVAYSGNLDAGTYPRRFLYPKNSYDYNPNVPELVPLGTKMWWHK